MKFASCFAILFFALAVLCGDEKSFVVVIPSYNNAAYCKKNLDSVFFQNYQNFRVIYIDDASIDGTGEIVRAHIREMGQESRIIFIQNQIRVGSLANKHKGIWCCDPREIVVDLDGDDWLAHENVLSHLNQVYSDPDIWVTYGQFVYHPSGARGWADEVPQEIVAGNGFREYLWVTTALRTFYAGLFQKIHREDFLYNGTFFPMAGDLAYMFPIVEMAGVHSCFIPEVLYVYNISTGINDVVTDPDHQRQLGWIVRDRKKYFPERSPY